MPFAAASPAVSDSNTAVVDRTSARLGVNLLARGQTQASLFCFEARLLSFEGDLLLAFGGTIDSPLRMLHHDVKAAIRLAPAATQRGRTIPPAILSVVRTTDDTWRWAGRSQEGCCQAG